MAWGKELLERGTPGIYGPTPTYSTLMQLQYASCMHYCSVPMVVSSWECFASDGR